MPAASSKAARMRSSSRATGSTRHCIACNSMRKDSADRFLQRVWYQDAGQLVSLLLLPLSWLFAALVWLRRACFRAGVLRSHRFDVPVIVVGNVTVGGTGKTPFT